VIQKFGVGMGTRLFVVLSQVSLIGGFVEDLAQRLPE
jgi:hypothetical protein